MTRPLPVTAVVVAVSLAAAAAAARAAPAARWAAPIAGPIAGRFAYDASRPYARGQRRGIDFAAPRGARVAAPCAGRVSFAGALPGGGVGVTVRCGALAATVLGLGRPAVRRGAVVMAG